MSQLRIGPREIEPYRQRAGEQARELLTAFAAAKNGDASLFDATSTWILREVVPDPVAMHALVLAMCQLAWVAVIFSADAPDHAEGASIDVAIADAVRRVVSFAAIHGHDTGTAPQEDRS